MSVDQMSNRTQVINDLEIKRGELAHEAQMMIAALEQAAYAGLVEGNYGTGEATLEHRRGQLAAQRDRIELLDLAIAGARRAR